jgi:hemerythrin
MLTWTPSLLIGVPWIDAQHQALFLRAERFAAASRAGEPGYRLEELFTFLSNYTLEHFAARPG